MASLLGDADRTRALQLVSECSEGCRTCCADSAGGDDDASAACLADCLVCSVFCRGAEMLLSRRSRFDGPVLGMAIEAAAT